jgi:hypothetical protein
MVLTGGMRSDCTPGIRTVQKADGGHTVGDLLPVPRRDVHGRRHGALLQVVQRGRARLWSKALQVRPARGCRCEDKHPDAPSALTSPKDRDFKRSAVGWYCQHEHVPMNAPLPVEPTFSPSVSDRTSSLIAQIPIPRTMPSTSKGSRTVDGCRRQIRQTSAIHRHH